MKFSGDSPAMARDNDPTDRRLLALLQANSRESTATLARKLKVARTTVGERIARLERNGTISGYSVLLKRDPSDQDTEAVVLLTVTQRRQRAVAEALGEFPEIKLCQSVSGEFELMCRVRTAQLEDLQPVLDLVAAIAGVERVKAIIVLATNFDRTHVETMSAAARQAARLEKGEAG